MQIPLTPAPIITMRGLSLIFGSDGVEWRIMLRSRSSGDKRALRGSNITLAAPQGEARNVQGPIMGSPFSIVVSADAANHRILRGRFSLRAPRAGLPVGSDSE